ncbi:hypothetical protein [Massilia sp. Dwa41.01b]|uniref:hypothetical protein n=1 Tax=Massilia sp. Dwa41.01b TaxID=2709302 RepID=UPI001AEF2FCB|nr:hypothetical protein [Massilia sp. Dwa41.01b]
MTPTLGQAVWTTGFSQSFANGSLFDIHTHAFGIPRPAAIAFGLAGAWPAGLLIRLGLHPADAYAGMVAAWLGLAMFSAYRVARLFGAGRPLALPGAVAWMSMPIVWAHAGYSMLSLGIALLPFYFMAAIRLFMLAPGSRRIGAADAALYCAAAVLSVFMDGYTFMMFACGASMFLLYAFLVRPEARRTLACFAVPVHVASFGLAYLLFSAYIGKSHFEAQQLDFFRAWGLDLSFAAIPTRGLLWLPDLLGWSVERSDARYFGDDSVWRTTFALPLLLVALAAWWRGRQKGFATAAVLVAAFGFYMALGPALKINATKPVAGHAAPSGRALTAPPPIGLVPTGNAWISETLPGFNVMRASYRWSALGIFALWLLVMVRIGGRGGQDTRPWLAALLLIILFNLPDLRAQWRQGVDNRTMFKQIDQDLVASLRRHIRPAETVMFLPWNNDFMANYLAPRANFRTFNIGGDKNLAAALPGWPAAMQGLNGDLDAGAAPVLQNILVDGTTDVIVLPYVHMLWSPHLWPCPDRTIAHETQKSPFRTVPGFSCPGERRAQLLPLVHALRALPYLEVEDTEYYATIRLRPQFQGSAARTALLRAIYDAIPYPLVLGSAFRNAPLVLKSGWHGLEAQHVWSQAAATLQLPRPTACTAKGCEATLHFAVFGASPARPVAVVVATGDRGRPWSRKLVASSGESMQVKLPVPAGDALLQEVSISIPDAMSPQALQGIPDPRVLGIALQRIDLTSQ